VVWIGIFARDCLRARQQSNLEREGGAELVRTPSNPAPLRGPQEHYKIVIKMTHKCCIDSHDGSENYDRSSAKCLFPLDTIVGI
jgi:hypothetical protein